MPFAALVPLIVVALAWIAYGWWDLARSGVQHLPKWGWALVIALSVPVGGILYMLVGRTER